MREQRLCPFSVVREVLGQEGYRVKVIEPYQMLGRVDEKL